MAKLQIEGTDANTSTISVVRNSNDTNPSYIHFGKSRGTATGDNTTLQTGDSIGAYSSMLLMVMISIVNLRLLELVLPQVALRQSQLWVLILRQVL